ncbi:acyl-CoA synthetase [soil metagenome]
MFPNLADLFEAVADAVTDREAVVCDGVRLSYAQLDERADRFAAVLADAGLQVGDMVGLALQNSAQHLECLLGAFKARTVPVNVNYRYRAEELRHLIDDAPLRLLVHEPALGEEVREAACGARRPPATLVRGSSYEATLAATPGRGRRLDRSGEDRYVLYTGGTTGEPKGVVWRHGDLFHAALGAGNPGGDPVRSVAELAAAAAASGGARCALACPLTHGTAQWMALTALLGGGTVVLDCQPGLAPARLWDEIEAERASRLVIVGDAFARPLVDALAAGPDRWDLSNLTVVISGGAVLSPGMRGALLAHLPWAAVVDGYGTSETGGQGRMTSWAGLEITGRPRFTVRADTAVLDDDLRPVAPGSGEVGYLARRGHLPLGYHNDPIRTARTFRTVAGVRWAVPGDLATVDVDGTVTLLGRGSQSINSGGEKVHPDEVEATIKTHPGVLDAVVVGVPDDRWGERIAAVVTTRPGADLGLDELAEHCRGRLAAFKAPRQLVVVGEVRRSPSGKPDYRWARAQATRGATRSLR